MNATQRHWQREMNALLNAQDEAEDKGLKLGKKHYARVKFVAACIAANAD